MRTDSYDEFLQSNCVIQSWPPNTSRSPSKRIRPLSTLLAILRAVGMQLSFTPATPI